jgi:hypothetical protein
MAAASSALPAIFCSSSEGSILVGALPGTGPVEGPDIVLVTLPACSGNRDVGMNFSSLFVSAKISEARAPALSEESAIGRRTIAAFPCGNA